MRLETLITEQRIPRPLYRVFPFFQSPENLALITPEDLRFRLLTRPPVTMKKGAIIDYTISLYSVPVHWQTLISDYEPPFRFVDKQLQGPYAFWEHEHTFDDKDGHTVVKDEVRYALPTFLPDPVSRLVHSIYVRPKLERIFRYRQCFFRTMFDRELG